MTSIANRYEVLETLGAGGMGVVYLVRDRLRSQRVALKQVLTSSDDRRLALTREFRTLSTLRHPNIVSVIDYGSHEGQPYFTMEYLPNAVPFDQTPDHKVERFIQMLQALGYLHRRGVLHQDLKPGNVLVTADGVVKVVDFGLAHSSTISQPEGSGGMVGTVMYMAPELFHEQPASVASDLWAAGIMLCELLTGKHPFNTSKLIDLMRSIIKGQPTLDDLDLTFLPVVLRLLAKDPDDRYPSALAVIHDLCIAAGLDLPVESRAQRESFLQAAAFVGRDDEYHRLVGGLHIAAGGSGQLWLIGGEAGVGKSRLLDELRTRALVDGFTVLQGQAVEGGGLPYQMWREPARRLLLGAPIQDFAASVLKELVPDVEALLERPIPDLPALEPTANRDRLMTALIERLRALASPVLLILEDVHWAIESLDLLRLLGGHLHGLPIMVIGSYRHDEKPTLPDSLPGATVMLLERLNAQAVEALSASMIGVENATPALVERLAKETEGNALFMVEVVRALAEEAGSLHEISLKTLPERIFAGGMVALLRRRLSRVPEWAVETLRLTAAIGRSLDLAVLRAAGVGDIDLWLQACAEAAVLEPYQGEWRFSHDRLREVLLDTVPFDALAALHRRAALLLEAVYPDNVNYAEALAGHWRTAGNPEREVYYLTKTGEYLVQLGADYTRAEIMFRRALELGIDGTQANLLCGLGNALERQARYADALRVYQQALEVNPTPTLQSSLLNGIAYLGWRQGKYADAFATAERARALAEAHQDRRNMSSSARVMGLLMIADNRTDKARGYFAESIRLQQALGDQRGVARDLNNMGVAVRVERDYAAAAHYYEEARRIQVAIGDRMGLSTLLINLGIVAMYQAQYAQAISHFEESLKLCRDTADRYNIAVNASFIAESYFGQANYESAREWYDTSLHLCREIGESELFVSIAGGVVATRYQLGEIESARSLLIETLQAVLDINSVLALLDGSISAAFWLLAQGQFEEAAVYIGMMFDQGTAALQDATFVRYVCREARAALGDAAFEAALRRGKGLEMGSVVEHLLTMISGHTPKSAAALNSEREVDV